MNAAVPSVVDAGERDERRFVGVTRLVGQAVYERAARAHVVVVGIGGVGSWAAEALARSAVGAITLIDLDHIAPGNTNRQIHALGNEYGRAKVLAMAERIAAINPACRVTAIEAFVTPENVRSLVPACDGVLDCIDQVAAKAALIADCRARGIRLVTSGAAGGRIDPTRIRRDDLTRVTGDALLAKVRARLRRDHGFAPGAPAPGKRARPFGVTAVYSDEPIRQPPQWATAGAGERDFGAGLACTGYGSSVMVTAPLGFAVAATIFAVWMADADSLDSGQSDLAGRCLASTAGAHTEEA